MRNLFTIWFYHLFMFWKWEKSTGWLKCWSRGAKHSHLNRFPISKAVADEGYSYLELYEWGVSQSALFKEIHFERKRKNKSGSSERQALIITLPCGLRCRHILTRADWEEACGDKTTAALERYSLTWCYTKVWKLKIYYSSLLGFGTGHNDCKKGFKQMSDCAWENLSVLQLRAQHEPKDVILY